MGRAEPRLGSRLRADLKVGRLQGRPVAVNMERLVAVGDRIAEGSASFSVDPSLATQPITLPKDERCDSTSHVMNDQVAAGPSELGVAKQGLEWARHFQRVDEM